MDDLLNLNLVSIKVDSVVEETWKKINRPHTSLKLDLILDDIREFSRVFHGKIITETMLVKEFNTNEQEIKEIANFISKLKFSKAYLAVPIRPPAEKWVSKPSEEELLMAYNVFNRELGMEKVELLNMPEPDNFQLIESPLSELLRLTAVHPLRIDYAVKILSRFYDDPLKEISELEKKKLIKILEYDGVSFIVRRF